ncbi:enoyl-CoA hydratase/isomerase family protein [uncultured Albimonas sp.]|uniref:enoyl-CoA hydratase/isomerase family protein n=1 Tax=uncultured Albimonas sp. TaxID=1331701 RepID=UPI0030EF0842|tara:strand:+ start:2709 stop:3410 length:702 start_codon:yes stop_codon:yes gene_type:complete
MSDLLLTQEDGILWASINRAERGGSISRALADAYVAAVSRVREDSTLKGLIWTSESPRVFSGGVDLKTPEGMAEAEVGPYRIAIVRDMLDATTACPRPIVTMARGRMLGLAFMNALLTDRIVADETASFQLPEVRIGIASPFAAAIVESTTSKGLAYDICMSARAVPARELERRGGPCTLVPADQLREAAVERLETLAAMPAEAFGYMKRWFMSSRLEAMTAALDHSRIPSRG